MGAAPPFADIVDQVNGSMRVLCAHQQQAGDHSFFYRAVFCVRVERDLFDLIFDSREEIWTLEIINGRWDAPPAPYARYGEQAPYLTKILIFGVFVNSAGDEFVPRRKVRRAYDMHQVGWS